MKRMDIRWNKFLSVLVAVCMIAAMLPSMAAPARAWDCGQQGHCYDGVAYDKDPTQHWRKCTYCNEDSPKENHAWTAASYSWANDCSTCTASHSCTVCGYSVNETVDASHTVKTAASCEGAEISTFTATFTKTGFSTQTKDAQTADPLGHDWGANTYSWSADNSACTATRCCVRDPSHTETETVQTTSVTTATCTDPGTTTYTATFTNDAFNNAGMCDPGRIKEIGVGALGHDFVDPSYAWAADYSTCTATRTCSRCGEQTTDTVDAASVTTAATDTESAYVTYTAEFSFGTKTLTVTLAGSCGENVTWALDNGVLTISGTGAMTDYAAAADRPWHNYKDWVTAVVVEDGVTGIGDYAFETCSNLAAAPELPAGVERIGNCAFAGCINMEGTLTIPDGVTEIGGSAFVSCMSLTGELVIPDSVTSLGNAAFSSCSGLTALTVGSGVPLIGSSAFSSCTQLKTVVIKGAHDGSGAALTVISGGTFGGCGKINSLTLGDGVLRITQGAFGGCTKLEGILVIPESVETVDGGAFGGVPVDLYVHVGTTEDNCGVTGEVIRYADVTVAENAHGTVTVSGDATPDELAAAGRFTAGDAVTVTVTPETGYHIASVRYRDASDHKLTPAEGVYAFTMPEKDVTVSAVIEVDMHTVTFQDEDGTVLQSSSVAYGETPVFEGGEPTKTATAQHSYAFSGWSPAIAAVTGDATYTATYGSEVNEYTIRFVDADGTELQSGPVLYGTTPEYTGEEPAKAATAQYAYAFTGWDSEIAPVTGPATYTATYGSTLNKYTVRFVNEDGTELQSSLVTYGTTPEYTGGEPAKDATAQYSYAFAGWDSEPAPVTGDATYTATYTNTLNSHTVKFVNEDGTVLQSGSVAYGKTPVYEGEAPTKAATAQFSYTFAGWDKEIAAVTGAATYTATYTETVNKYTVRFLNADGTELQSGSVAYGETPAYAGETPEKAATDEFTYTFAGWDAELAAVTGDAT